MRIAVHNDRLVIEDEAGRYEFEGERLADGFHARSCCAFPGNTPPDSETLDRLCAAAVEFAGDTYLCVFFD